MVAFPSRWSVTFATLLAAVAVLVPAIAMAFGLTDPGTWSSRFALPYFATPVGGSVEYQGELVTFGDFAESDRDHAQTPVRWHDGRWQPLGLLHGQVTQLVIYRGELIACGWGLAVPHDAGFFVLVRWDGTEWREFFTQPLTGSISQAVVLDSLLVVAGTFQETASNLLSWDGHTWDDLGGGPAGQVTALGFAGGALHAAVSIYETPERGVGLIERWANREWSVLGDTLGAPVGHTWISSLAEFQGALHAGGIVPRAGAEAGILGRWDGAAWNWLLSPRSGTVLGMCTIDDTLWLAGSLVSPPQYRPAHSVLGAFDGVSVFPDTTTGLEVESVAPFQHHPVVAGMLVTGNWNVSVRTVSTRAAGTWQVHEPWRGDEYGLTSTPSAIVRFGGDVIAAGQFSWLGAGDRLVHVDGIARWDGTCWHPMGRTEGWQVLSLAIYRGSLVAGGNFYSGDERGVSNLARWNGTDWESFGDGTNGPVNTLLVDGDTLYAGGNFSSPARLVAAWDGGQWTARDLGEADEWSWVRTLAKHDGALYVGGNILVDGLSNLARWDGTRWVDVGGGTDQAVTALASTGHVLLVGGWFTQVGGRPITGFAAWNGVDWSGLGVVSGTVDAIQVAGNEIVIGGGLQDIDHTFGGGVFSWHDGAWHALAGGVNGQVTVLSGDRDALVAGGWFTRAAGQASFYIAQWRSARSTPPDVTAPSLTLASANPFASSVALATRLPAAGSIDLRVYDITGRHIVTLAQGTFAAGPHEFTWNGYDTDGRRVRAGVYFARLETAQGTGRTRLVCIP